MKFPTEQEFAAMDDRQLIFYLTNLQCWTRDLLKAARHRLKVLEDLKDTAVVQSTLDLVEAHYMGLFVDVYDAPPDPADPPSGGEEEVT